MAPADANLETTLASELLDQLGAGNETSAITLLYLFHSLAQRPELQSRLRTELLTLTPAISHASTTLPPPKAIDALPLLHACVMETLRLYASIPGPQPRITPHTCTLGSYTDIPAGVRVSAQAWSLHRNGAVYADPEAWRPERWLGDPTSPEMLEMQRWFWAFGSGGRMCVGSNLAVQQIKLVTAALMSNYSLSIVDDTDVQQEDAYVARPTSGKLVLGFHRVASVG